MRSRQGKEVNKANQGDTNHTRDVLTPSLNARFKKERSQDVACPHGPFPPRVRDPNVTLPSSEIIRTL